MREIKFRGFVPDAAMGNGAWDYATPDDSHWEQFWFITDPSTRGQYTGLKDKNGVEIYEGDVVECVSGGRNTVEYNPSAEPWSFMRYWESADEFEVIGNIYENPELISDAQ